MMRNGVCDDLEFIDREAMKRHPYYQEFLAPFGLLSFAGVRVATNTDVWCLSLQRGILDDRFSPGEKQKLVRLSNCLSSAATVTQALGFAATDSALEAFEVSGTGILLVNWRGEVVRMNGSAERMLGHGVRIVARRLVAADAGSTNLLNRVLHRLLWTPSEAALSPPVALTRQDRGPLLAYPLKLVSLTANPFVEARALIALIDPATKPKPPESTLREVFGLTVAEARLAARLACGEALEAIADDLNVAKETARFHLKRIFIKTGVRRQAELVALFARLLSPRDEGH
ncbi:MAG: helix-turn-helix transcriptional regulator [Xanthobacteraceae bacterium]